MLLDKIFFIRKPLKNLKRDYYKLKKINVNKNNHEYLWIHHENNILMKIENKGTGG